MIYICKGAKQICMLPCKLCQCLDAICSGMCRAINESCGVCKDGFRGCIAPISGNPLGTFVLGTWAIQGIIICACIYAISSLGDGCGFVTTTAPPSRRLSTYEEEEAQDNDEQSAVTLFCIIEIIFAVIHCVFAYYIQRRLVSKIAAADAATSMSKLIWELLKYDIAFCLYVFFAMAAPAYALSQSGDVRACDNSSSNTGTGAAIFLACCYVVLEFFYMCCFVCGAGAKSTVSSIKATMPDTRVLGASSQP